MSVPLPYLRRSPRHLITRTALRTDKRSFLPSPLMDIQSTRPTTATPKDGVVLVAAVSKNKQAQAPQHVRLSVYRYREGLLHNADDLWNGPMTGQHLKPGQYYFSLPEANV